MSEKLPPIQFHDTVDGEARAILAELHRRTRLTNAANIRAALRRELRHWRQRQAQEERGETALQAKARVVSKRLKRQARGRIAGAGRQEPGDE